MNGTNGTYGEHQLIISYELLALFCWIMEYEEENLKQLIAHALASGFKKELDAITKLNFNKIEDIKYKIEDFFGLLETLLLEAIDEHTMQKAEDINLKTSIDQIDTHEYDTQTVIATVEKVTTEPEISVNPKELLYKELLHQWKPTKNHLIN